MKTKDLKREFLEGNWQGKIPEAVERKFDEITKKLLEILDGN